MTKPSVNKEVEQKSVKVGKVENTKKSILDSHAAVYTLIGFGFTIGLVLGQLSKAPDQNLLDKVEQYKTEVNILETEISRLNNVIKEQDQVVQIDSKTVRKDEAFTVCNSQVFIEVVGVYPSLERLDLEIKVQNGNKEALSIGGRTTKEAFSYNGDKYVIAVTEYSDSIIGDDGSAVLSIYKKE
jgi:hypothetical protein